MFLCQMEMYILKTLRIGAQIGTSSNRRAAQIKKLKIRFKYNSNKRKCTDKNRQDDKSGIGWNSSGSCWCNEIEYGRDYNRLF